MARKNLWVNSRVIIEVPYQRWAMDPEKATKRLCAGIVDDVKRHVDNHGYVGVEHEHESCCEFCLARWTEDSADYNGGCCDKDEEANPCPPMEGSDGE